jgi:hypothetical protein
MRSVDLKESVNAKNNIFLKFSQDTFQTWLKIKGASEM